MAQGKLSLIAAHLLRRTGVQWKWLTRSSSRIDSAFATGVRVSATPDLADDGSPLQRVEISHPQFGTRLFCWPAGAPLESLLVSASELMQPEHPHHYFFRGTTIRPADVVIDIGACEGSFSAEAASLGATPVVVEPSRRMHPIIRHMFKLRGMADPLIAPVALGASSGQITFTDDTSNPGASFITPTSASTPAGPSTGLITYPVRIQTLDEMVHELKLPKVDYIKCDAEGFDLDVLRGSMQTIRRHKPRLALCTYHKPNHYDEMKSLLSGLGYTIQGKGLFNAGDKLHVLMLHAWQI